MSAQRARRHQPRHVSRHEVHGRVHGGHRAGNVNAWLAVHITTVVGSMWCAYAFAAIALISLPAALATWDTIVIVSWVAQTFLQLVLLSVIMVGQRVLQEASDARAEADHETLGAIHTLSGDIHRLQELQTDILERLDDRPPDARFRRDD